MLIFLQNGEQRLITFTLPKESCTLQEVLEQVHSYLFSKAKSIQEFRILWCHLFQVNVPFTEDTHIQCMQNTSSEIDYFVSVGSTTRIEEMLENHPVSKQIFLVKSSLPKYMQSSNYSWFFHFFLQILVGDLSSRNSPSVMSQPQSSEMSTPEKSQCPENGKNSLPYNIITCVNM